MEKWAGGGRGGRKKSLPARLVRLQNPYTRWMGALIGAVGWKLIDACQFKVVFPPADSLTHRSTFVSLYAGYVACVASRHFFSCSWK